MTALTREQMIDRVRGCFALGGSPNENEAAQAVERAHALILKYNLDISEVVEVPLVSPVGELPVETGRSIPIWKQMLYQHVARSFYCKAFILKWVSRGDTQASQVFVGREHNREMAAEVAVRLARICDSLAYRATLQYTGWDPRGRKRPKGFGAWQRSFLFGLVGRIGQRLEAQRHQDEGTVGVMSLVVALDQEAEIYLEGEYPETLPGRKIRPVIGSAYLMGAEAGNSVALGGAPLPTPKGQIS